MHAAHGKLKASPPARESDPGDSNRGGVVVFPAEVNQRERLPSKARSHGIFQEAQTQTQTNQETATFIILFFIHFPTLRLFIYL